jgi:hypothetical protein
LFNFGIKQLKEITEENMESQMAAKKIRKTGQGVAQNRRLRLPLRFEHRPDR